MGAPLSVVPGQPWELSKLSRLSQQQIFCDLSDEWLGEGSLVRSQNRAYCAYTIGLCGF